MHGVHKYTVAFVDVMYVMMLCMWQQLRHLRLNNMRYARTPFLVRACTHACACICCYSGCTCACNACPINGICIVMYVQDMCCYTHTHTYDVLLLCYCIYICDNMLPSLCINMVHICEMKMMCDVHSMSHHDCAVRDVSSYHHIIHYSYICV